MILQLDAVVNQVAVPNEGEIGQNTNLELSPHELIPQSILYQPGDIFPFIIWATNIEEKKVCGLRKIKFSSS